MTLLSTILADVAIGGSGGFGNTLLWLFVQVVVGLIVWKVLRWILGQWFSATVVKAWDCICVFFALVIFVNAGFTMGGHPFIHW